MKDLVWILPKSEYANRLIHRRDMTIREISKETTRKRNKIILKMLLRMSVKDVATRFCLSPMAIYQIAFRHKQGLDGRN